MKLLVTFLALAAGASAASRSWSTSESSARDGQRRLASGLDHVCAINHDGLVACWGAALGNGNTTLQSAPVIVRDLNQNLLTGIIEVTAGTDFTCALAATGQVSCWGKNNRGQLGDGGFTDRARSAPVNGINDAVRVTAGLTWACALRQSGTVSCWGANFSGQLGTGAVTADQPNPVPVINLDRVIDIAAGSDHTCALLVYGNALCWGGNQNGQLGNGSSGGAPIPSPVDVVGLVQATSISAGTQSTCATAIGGVRCWGLNASGQLGTNDNLLRSSATFIGLSDTWAVGRGNDHYCFITAGGVAKCQGSGRSGKLGNGGTLNQPLAVTVAGASFITAITGGTSHTCLMRANGTVECVGSNQVGQLGNGGATGAGQGSLVLVNVGTFGGPRARAIATGSKHTCALRGDGSVACWGDDQNAGVLGNGVLAPNPLQPTAVTVAGLTDVVAISTSDSHTCALRANGRVSCWGKNGSGQTGNGNTGLQATPFELPGISNAIAVTAGGAHTCALNVNGTAKCWGSNTSRQTGSGSIASTVFNPILVQTNALTGINAGRAHNCARRANGVALCWGADDFGQIANGAIQPFQALPHTVEVSDVLSITTGDDNSCALLADGARQCWGRNNRGQLGSPVLGNLTLPTNVAAAGVMVAQGALHSCVIGANGLMVCMGETLNGRLGNNVTAAGVQSTPVPLAAANAFIAMSAGQAHTCAIRFDGIPLCWGAGSSHQLGNGSTADRGLPFVVSTF